MSNATSGKPDLTKFMKGGEATTETPNETESSSETVSPDESKPDTTIEGEENLETQPTDTDTDTGEVKEGEDEDQPWFRDEELDIIYNSEEEAKRGLVEKEKYIRQKLDLLKATQERLSQIEQEKSKLETRQGNQET